jgi:aryl-alcohol dehydrogenase-like predicted oxidoreductase
VTSLVPPMAMAPLGQTGLEISRIGLGAWAMGGAGWWEFGWSGQSDADSIAAIERALGVGINWIDTAGGYGFGHSEEVIGRALRGVMPRPFVFTKCSVVEGPDRAVVHSLKRDSIRREAELSLKRLGGDAIDLLQLHEPVPEPDIEEGWSALAELRSEGVVRHIGVSNFTPEQMARLETIAPVEVIQPPYSLIDTSAEAGVLEYASAAGAGVIVYSPLASGLLGGRMTREDVMSLPDSDWRTRDAAFAEPALSANLALAGRLSVVAAELGVSTAEVAVAWTLGHPTVTGAIVGCRRPAYVDAIRYGSSPALSAAVRHALADMSRT